MDKSGKYLRVTIHDNDYRGSLRLMGRLLYELFYHEDKYPTEEQFPVLKECIKHLWFSTEMTQDLMRWGDIVSLLPIDEFEPHLEFVNYQDIPDWDNGESIYIPMFDDAEILAR